MDLVCVPYQLTIFYDFGNKFTTSRDPVQFKVKNITCVCIQPNFDVVEKNLLGQGCDISKIIYIKKYKKKYND